MSEEKFEGDELDDLLETLKMDDAENIDLENINDYFGFDIFGLEKEMESFQDTLEFRFSKSNPDAVDPKYAYTSDSGFDLYSTEDIWLFPFSSGLVPTGLHLDIPEGYEIQIRSKSGLALNSGLFVLNSPGTVDEGYTGEIKVILFNTTNEKVKILKGQKVAQAVLCPVVSGKWISFVEVSDVNSKDRNDKGFGSTGIK